MPVYLQRIRLTVHTKKQFQAGTNSPVSLGYAVEEKHVHPKLEPGVHYEALDHPWHDDFQSGKADSYEIRFDTGTAGRAMGRPVPGGIQFDSLEDAGTFQLHLRIDGNDQWIFDRLALGGYFVEVRPSAGSGDEHEEVEIGWIEMAKHSEEVRMSSDPEEGYEEVPIELNGSFR